VRERGRLPAVPAPLSPAESGAYTSLGCFSGAEDLASLRSGVTALQTTPLTPNHCVYKLASTKIRLCRL